MPLLQRLRNLRHSIGLVDRMPILAELVTFVSISFALLLLFMAGVIVFTIHLSDQKVHRDELREQLIVKAALMGEYPYPQKFHDWGRHIGLSPESTVEITYPPSAEQILQAGPEYTNITEVLHYRIDSMYHFGDGDLYRVSWFKADAGLCEVAVIIATEEDITRKMTPACGNYPERQVWPALRLEE